LRFLPKTAIGVKEKGEEGAHVLEGKRQPRAAVRSRVEKIQAVESDGWICCWLHLSFSFSVSCSLSLEIDEERD
jgi:hypothetical protein